MNSFPKLEPMNPPRLGGVLRSDDFSLRHRCIDTADLAEEVTVAGMNDLVSLLTLKGTKPIWHS
jgi:hypothetical protein